jgi:hypothetical protein
MYKDTMNVEHEMFHHTGINWNQWNSNTKLKEKLGNHTRKAFNRFNIKDCYNRIITHNTESTAV